MKQPETGIKIKEIRIKRGFTQKDLSEACIVDIRTIQRIETGEVIPRFSTLKIIAAALDYDPSELYTPQELNSIPQLKNVLFISLVSGIIYFFSWLIYIRFIPVDAFFTDSSLRLTLSVVYLLTGVFFYYGFYMIGKLYNNKTIQITSAVVMIIIPFFIITDLLTAQSGYHFNEVIMRGVVILLGINGFLFGLGMATFKGPNQNLFKSAGILQLITAPMFIIQVPLIQMAGLWLSVPYIILLISIVLMEYRQTRL